MTINYADAAVALILLICALNAGRRGIARFIAGVTGSLISLFLSVTLHGKISALLRETPLFDFLFARIRPFFDFESAEELAEGLGGFSQNALSERILANDNSEIYKLFGVDAFADYVASYAVNIALNIISIVAVYLLVSLIIRALFSANVVFSKIPVVRTLNFAAGAVGGLIEGVLLIWILIIVLVFFALQGAFLPIYDALMNSAIAVYFYKYNVFLYAILSITA